MKYRVTGLTPKSAEKNGELNRLEKGPVAAGTGFVRPMLTLGVTADTVVLMPSEPNTRIPTTIPEVLEIAKV